MSQVLTVIIGKPALEMIYEEARKLRKAFTDPSSDI